MVNQHAILFLLMRTDMKSMNPGKAIAQGSHAANAAVKHAKTDKNVASLLDIWENETNQGFGTVLTLDASSEENMTDLIAEVEVHGNLRKEAFVAGVVNDPTYPIRDGDVTHHLSVNTCAYVMCFKDSSTHNIIKHLNLYK